jgi:hypothetical protein
MVAASEDIDVSAVVCLGYQLKVCHSPATGSLAHLHLGALVIEYCLMVETKKLCPN